MFIRFSKKYNFGKTCSLFKGWTFVYMYKKNNITRNEEDYLNYFVEKKKTKSPSFDYFYILSILLKEQFQ